MEVVVMNTSGSVTVVALSDVCLYTGVTNPVEVTFLVTMIDSSMSGSFVLEVLECSVDVDSNNCFGAEVVDLRSLEILCAILFFFLVVKPAPSRNSFRPILIGILFLPL